MLTVVSDSADRDGSGAARSAASSVIDELVREGARRMLAEALRAEVEAYIAQFADVRDEKGHRLVVRNGCHESRTVTTSAGAVDVTAPRVNDKRVDPDTGERQRFSSSILPPWARKTPKIGEVLPLLYLHGLSSGDFVPALGQFLGSAKGLSASTITKLTETWKAEQRAFAERDLSGVDFVYLWADGIHVNVRLDDQKLCLLVMIGVRADGRKELVALTDGYREAAESWADLLRDCRRRGMRAPVLAAGDGALGFWSALREVFPETREQRCWFHKISNVLAALPKSAHPGAKKALAEIWNAEDKSHARDAVKAVRVDLWCEVSEGGRQDQRRRRAAAGVLRLPGRALDSSENDESDRIYLRHRAEPEQDHQGPGLARRRNRHGLQADRGGPVTLAGGQRAPSRGARPRRREVRERQTRRTARRHHRYRGGRIKDLDPQVLTIAQF